MTFVIPGVLRLGVGQFENPDCRPILVQRREPFVLGVQSFADCQNLQVTPPDPRYLKLVVRIDLLIMAMEYFISQMSVMAGMFVPIILVSEVNAPLLKR